MELVVVYKLQSCFPSRGEIKRKGKGKLANGWAFLSFPSTFVVGRGG
jgi:hypothetical protein